MLLCIAWIPNCFHRVSFLKVGVNCNRIVCHMSKLFPNLKNYDWNKARYIGVNLSVFNVPKALYSLKVLPKNEAFSPSSLSVFRITVLALSEFSSLYAHLQPRRSKNSFTCCLKYNSHTCCSFIICVVKLKITTQNEITKMFAFILIANPTPPAFLFLNIKWKLGFQKVIKKSADNDLPSIHMNNNITVITFNSFTVLGMIKNSCNWQ